MYNPNQFSILTMPNPYLFLLDPDQDHQQQPDEEFHIVKKRKDYHHQCKCGGDHHQSGETVVKEEDKSRHQIKPIKTTVITTPTTVLDEDGFRTPTSQDRRIQPFKHCPPPPRKPKRFFIRCNGNRKSPNVRLDFSREIDSFFASTVMKSPHLLAADVRDIDELYNNKMKRGRGEIYQASRAAN